MECDGCKNNNGKINNDLILCKNCLNPKSLKLITKSNACKKYLLNKNDFDDLRFAHGYMNIYGVRPCLYLIDDVEEKSIEKHGNIKNVLEKIKKRNDKKKEILKRKRENKKLRKLDLLNHLKFLNIKNPDHYIYNNEMCKNYINNCVNRSMTVEEIGNKILEDIFYDEKTEYNKIFYKIKRSKMDYNYNGYYRRNRFDKDNNFINSIKEKAKEEALYNYIEKNYLKTFKLLDELPESLKKKAFDISTMIYNVNNLDL